MPSLTSKPALIFIGVLIGYSLSRVLDNVPLINKIPKIRL